ncbi:MAG: PAS domain-containing sensor histidine kinase [Thermoplasmatota archaeon]
MKVEMELKERLAIYKERLEEAMDAGNLAWWEMELPSGKMTFNDRKAKMLGYSPERFSHYKDFTDLLHPNDHEEAMQGMREHLEGNADKYEVEYRIKKKSGDYQWFRDVGRITEEDDGYKKVTGVVIDIDQRKSMERELKKSEERYRTLVETSMIGIGITDFEDNLQFVNRRFAEMLGYRRDELEGKNLSDLTTKEEYEKIKARTNNRRDEKSGVYESAFIKNDRNVVNVLISATPFTDDEDSITGTIGFIQDITDRKEAEEREQFLHSLLRHDMKNKIQIIQGYLQLLEDFDLSEEAISFLSKAKKTVKDTTELIEKVRTLQRVEQEEIKSVNILSIIEDTVEGFRNGSKERDIEIDIFCYSSECTVKGGILLQEAFSNLLENAFKHSQCNNIEISCEGVGEEVLCKVEDDGTGIPNEEKNKIFQKGYTTDKKRGTGLGLFLVKMLIESYNGRVEVKDSELGGARFDIYLKKA